MYFDSIVYIVDDNEGVSTFLDASSGISWAGRIGL